MRLAHVDIRDYRSIFIDNSASALAIDLSPGMNTLIGLNNCGKSNVLRAISLALDPNHPFDPEWDAPGPRPFALPIITLRFAADGARPEEAAALAAATEYEAGLGVPANETRASNGEIILEVAFQREADGYRRRELLLAANRRVPSKPEDLARLDDALAKLRDAIRFVLISSGESIESVLEGNFREILHSVVRERLSSAFAEAEGSRQQYITGIQESLLAPLRDRLAGDVGGMFPEIATTQLSPSVPSIERTLSNVGVSLGDLVLTPLDQKGTGVRGGVLVAMLSYLALNATRGMVFAVEEPEAFLHPSSQEDLRDLLEKLALSTDVTLLVTTHSPYIATRSTHGTLFCLAKDPDGRTRLSQTASGDSPHAPLIGGLFRESSLEELLARATALPSGAEAVLLVEGEGDELSLKLAANTVGRPDLLEGIYIRPTGGTNKMVVEAVVARAGTDLPVFVLVDNDEHGTETLKLLCGQKFGFQKGAQVTTYAEIFPKDERNFPYEAEDLFAPALLEDFVTRHDPPIHEGSKKRPDGAFHYDFGQAAKGELDAHLHSETRPHHVERWIDLILLLRDRLGLTTPEQTAAEIVAAAEADIDQPVQAEGGSVLVLVDKLLYSRYQSSAALALDVDQQLPSDLTHIGFYYDATIQPTFPRVLADYPGLLYSASTAQQLRATGKDLDTRAAALIEQSIKLDDELADTTHRLLLLSEPTHPDTLSLDEPIQNTKTKAGRPLAWAISPQVVSWTSIAAAPATTDELDRLETNNPERLPEVDT